jgi:2-dehydropantoate 2-reductase
MSLRAPGAVVVMGAGSVGCYVGGRLQAAGADVHFVGRPRVLGALRQHGLVVTDLDGDRVQFTPGQLQLHDAPLATEPVNGALVLLCVKSGATAAAATALAAVLPPGTLVLSLQNGVANADLGAAVAPALTWLAGMVPYNVAELAPGHVHRGTAGRLAAQDHPALQAWLPVFKAAGLPLAVHADLRPVQWGKLLLNLNNPVNALSGLPLRAQLLNRNFRIVFAALLDEALTALRAAGISPARLTPLPPRLLPTALRLPTWLFRRVAARMLKIDDKARSSMADDLALGRPTEVDAFCGAVVRLAKAHGTAAPVNAKMANWLAAPRPQPMRGSEMRRQLGC